MDRPHVIVGNGVAGVNAAEAIRGRDPTTPIVILSDQECEFYSRPALYYILLGRIELADAAARPQGFYERNGFELRCSVRVRAIDADAHTVALSDGAQLGYRRLLLATGTSPRLPTWYRGEVQGFVFLNALTDVVEIAHATGEAESAVVVGGGLTSIEMVEALIHAGVETTFIMRGDRFLAGQLTPAEAAFVHDRLRGSGVEVLTSTEVTRVSVADGQVTGITTDRGETRRCQIVGVALGVTPNLKLAESAGAEVAQGIIVDEGMRTTLPDVFAAGDCAQVRRADGTVMPSELLWYVAQQMGQVAGANMAGDTVRYEHAPFMNVAELCGIDLCAVGDVTPEQVGVETLWAPDASRGTARLVLRDGRLIGGCFVGDIRLADVTRALISQGARWDHLPGRHPLRVRFRPAAARRPVAVP